MFQLSGFYCRFLSSPFIIRVPFFLIVSFNKGAQKQKGRKGTTQEPRQALLWTRAEVFYALKPCSNFLATTIRCFGLPWCIQKRPEVPFVELGFLRFFWGSGFKELGAEFGCRVQSAG